MRFGDFELDLRAAELRREGERIRLQEQPYRILAILLERPGEVVLREDIRRRLWPNDTVVEVGHGINAAVQRLREALGESAENPRFIETVARRGYRFNGERETVWTARAGPARTAAASTLQTGGTVSHYRILDRLGGGGMGAVYRAEDLELGREVALKLLHEDVAREPIAIGRFRREARAASALNHPNICTIYGVEEHAGQPVIVMELVEGETLEAILQRGRIEVPQALGAAVQIAAALGAAHRKGVVHRDLKPGNVIVGPAGVKVLDFGLAKMELPAGAADVTQEGAILGTLHYMSPEQVQGKEARAASDIFTFGVLLYEMLAGRKAFGGGSQAEVMSQILSTEPPPLDAPAAVDRVVRRCLAKRPEDRWQSAADLQAALQAVLELAGSAPSPAPRRARWRMPKITRRAATGLGLSAAIGLGIVAAMEMRPRGDHPPDVPVSLALLPDGNHVSLSPDGRRLAMVVGNRIVIRPLDASEPRTLPGTDGAGMPFWSPDGKSVAFTSGGKLRVTSIAGTTFPVELCSVNTKAFGSWGPDGTILMGMIDDGIFRVPASGGMLTRVTELDHGQGEKRHLAPQFLPDGRRYLFVAGSDKPEGSTLYVGALGNSERKPVMLVESTVVFVPEKPGASKGHLLLTRKGTLVARVFDSETGEAAGPEMVLADRVTTARAALAELVSMPDFSATPDMLTYHKPMSMAPRTPAAIIVTRNWRAQVPR